MGKSTVTIAVCCTVISIVLSVQKNYIILNIIEALLEPWISFVFVILYCLSIFSAEFKFQW